MVISSISGWAMRTIELVALLCAALLPLGCVDPMGNDDRISPVAGDAQQRNLRIHAIDPVAGDGPGPNPGGSGVRAARAIDAYRTGQVGAAASPAATSAAEPAAEE